MHHVCVGVYMYVWICYQPTASLGVLEQPTASLGVLEQPTASIGVLEQPTASLGVLEQPTASLGVLEQSTASSGGLEQPSTSSGGLEQPTASLGVLEQPTASLGVLEQPTASLVVLEQPTASLGVLEQPTASSPSTVLTSLDQYGSPTPLEGPKFPYLDMEDLTPSERDLTISKLSKDFGDHICKYDKFIIQYDKWIAKHITVDQYSNVLSKLDCVKSPKVGKNEPVPTFADSKPEIEKATTHDKLSTIVSRYINWFQCSLLHRIVSNACQRYEISKEAEEEFTHHVDQYEKELEKYCKRKIFECPKPSSLPIQCGAKYLRLKLGNTFNASELDADEIMEFQGRLTGTLGLYPDVLELKSVNKGCVELIISIFSSAHAIVFPLDDATQEALTLLGVVEIDTEGYRAEISQEPPHLLKQVMVVNCEFIINITAFQSKAPHQTNSTKVLKIKVMKL